MRRDAERVRKDKPTVFISLKTGEGLDDLIKIIRSELELEGIIRG